MGWKTDSLHISCCIIQYTLLRYLLAFFNRFHLHLFRYSVLSSSSGDVPLAKIDEYVKDSGDPDASKFLELVRRSVYPFYAFLQRSIFGNNHI